MQRCASKSDTPPSVPFQKCKILHDFFDLIIHLLMSKLIKIKCSVLDENRNHWNEILFLSNVFVPEWSEKRSSVMET